MAWRSPPALKRLVGAVGRGGNPVQWPRRSGRAAAAAAGRRGGGRGGERTRSRRARRPSCCLANCFLCVVARVFLGCCKPAGMRVREAQLFQLCLPLAALESGATAAAAHPQACPPAPLQARVRSLETWGCTRSTEHWCRAGLLSGHATVRHRRRQPWPPPAPSRRRRRPSPLGPGPPAAAPKAPRRVISELRGPRRALGPGRACAQLSAACCPQLLACCNMASLAAPSPPAHSAHLVRCLAAAAAPRSAATRHPESMSKLSVAAQRT